MEGSRLITHVLPVITIILAVVFFAAFKLISRAKNKAFDDKTGEALTGFQLDTTTHAQDPDRRKLICPVLLKKSRGVMKTSLKEITPSGAFLICPNPLPVGETFQVKILANDSEPLEFDAEVLWNNENVSADKVIHRGMKVRFFKLSHVDRKTLSEIVSNAAPGNMVAQ